MKYPYVMLKPQIIYEDESVLVLDKPAGVTVNRSDTTRDEQTLQDFLEEKIFRYKDKKILSENSKNPNISISQYPNIYEDENREAFYKRSGIVHRLDKETSGIILVAKTEDAFLELLRQFREREVEKRYTALVHGKVTPEIGEIDVPVGRLPWNRKRFGIVAGGREAKTRYRVISNLKSQISNEPLTLLELYPKTGRTHQIRVHLKYMNRPIFADSLYGGRKTARDDRKKLNRQFLHASSINFFHPISHKPLSFQSELPQDLRDVLSQMQATEGE